MCRLVAIGEPIWNAPRTRYVAVLEEKITQYRLYFLMPGVVSAQCVVNDLLLACVTERHIHFVSKPGINLIGLHEVSAFQTSDIVHAIQNGLVIGGGTGVLTGIVTVAFPVTGEGPQWGMVDITTVVSALFGTWTSSIIDSSVPNSRLKPFKQAVEDEQILLMVDVPHLCMSEVRALLQRTHSEGRFNGEGSAIPAFP